MLSFDKLVPSTGQESFKLYNLCAATSRTFSHMQKQEKRLIKRTIIPVKIEDNPRQLRGLIRFSTEAAKEKLHPLGIQILHKKNQVLYKNQILRQEEGEEDEKRKKEMELYEVSINPNKLKNQQFKVEIPIVRGPKSLKNSKANDLYFTFYYSGSEGKMALQNGYYEAKKEIIVKTKRELSQKERVDIQAARMDNRRKGDIDESKFRRDEDSDED